MPTFQEDILLPFREWLRHRLLPGSPYPNPGPPSLSENAVFQSPSNHILILPRVRELSRFHEDWVRACPSSPEPTGSRCSTNVDKETGGLQARVTGGQTSLSPTGAETSAAPTFPQPPSRRGSRRGPAGTWPAGSAPLRGREPAPGPAPRSRPAGGSPTKSLPAQRGPSLPRAPGPGGATLGTHTPAKDAATNAEGSAPRDGKEKGGPRWPRTGSEAAGSTTRRDAGDAARAHGPLRCLGLPRDFPRGWTEDSGRPPRGSPFPGGAGATRRAQRRRLPPPSAAAPVDSAGPGGAHQPARAG